MTNSRKQVMAQIAQLDQILQFQQSKLIAHKNYLSGKTSAENRLVVALTLLLPALFIGWKMGRGKWVGNAAKQLVEIGVLAATAQFKQQIINVFKKAF